MVVFHVGTDDIARTKKEFLLQDYKEFGAITKEAKDNIKLKSRVSKWQGLVVHQRTGKILKIQ